MGINTSKPGNGAHVVGDTRIEGTLTPNEIDYPFDKPYFGTSTAASTQVKVVSCPGFELKTGSRIAVQFTYGNSASQPKLNVNGTGDKFICSTDGMSVIADIWRDKETVDFVYDGSWWIAIGCLYATTAYYGLTKLSSSISSSSTTLAANSYAVKRAYDRSSWTSISLTNALAIAYGGTGAKNAAAARTNLGIAATSLYNGTLTSGSITFNYGNYNFYVISGRPSSTASRASLVVPKYADNLCGFLPDCGRVNYKSFNLNYSGLPGDSRHQGGNGRSTVYLESTEVRL